MDPLLTQDRPGQKKDGCQGRDRGQRRALLSGARCMHHPMGAESCRADPQQVKGVEGGGGVGWLSWRGMRSRPAGLLALARPRRGRTPGTRSRKKHCPPKRRLQQTGGLRTAAGGRGQGQEVRPRPHADPGGEAPPPRSPDHCRGAAGAPEQWKWTLSHLPSRRCHTRVSSDWLERGRPVLSTNCVRRM